MKYIIGLTFHSCPFMGINSGSNDVGAMWNVKQLRQDKRCSLCFSENLNSWFACIRKTSMINLHIGFVSRCRQSLLLVLQLSKYLPIPDTYRGQYFRFSGPIKEVVEPTNSRASIWQPRGFKNPGARIESDKSENYTLPREKHQQPIYAYGKLYIVWKCTVNIFSGNESLCDSLGYEAGSCLCLNGGGMNHSKLLSKNGGLSKALIMSLTLMVAPEDINTPMCYWECWTPLNMQRVFRRFIPLVNALCEALTHHFWVYRIFGWINFRPLE